MSLLNWISLICSTIAYFISLYCIIQHHRDRGEYKRAYLFESLFVGGIFMLILLIVLSAI